jgi:hypothetical protein
LLFAASLAAGYVLTTGFRKIAVSKPLFIPEAPVRLRSESNLYRTRFIRQEGDEMVFAAPISRESYVPIRVGEEVTIELLSEKGITLVRSTVVRRDDKTHEFAVGKPEMSSLIERREARRVAYEKDLRIQADSADAHLIDVSNRGAKFRTWKEFAKGERISIQLPWKKDLVGAWIIESAAAPKGTSGREYRAVFEEPVAPPKAIPSSF